jgi:hypothetical protein
MSEAKRFVFQSGGRERPPFVTSALLIVLTAMLLRGLANSQSQPGDALVKAKGLADQCSSLENSGDYSRAEAVCREALPEQAQDSVARPLAQPPNLRHNINPELYL